MLDAHGVIQDMAIQNEELAESLAGSPDDGPDERPDGRPTAWAGWLGRPVADTVAVDSRPKIELLLRDAAASTDAKWRHVNHLAPDGRSVPVLYCCVMAGGNGRVVAFGRGLSAISALQQRLMNAQQSLERDYSRMREVEMRYRLLFQMSSEAVLVIDPVKQRVVEANPAAAGLLGAAEGELAGYLLPEIFGAEGMGAVEAHLSAVRAGVRADEVRARLAHRGANGDAEVLVKASLFRQDGATLFLVRVAASSAPPGVPDVKAKLLKAVESAPDGFVVTDYDGVVLTANAAFLEAAELASEEQARGKPLDRWVGESGVDLDLLIANVRQRGSVRFFCTTLRGEGGGTGQVEISAVAVRNGGQPSLGFAIRSVGSRLQAAPPAARKLPRPVEQLTELIGRVALKDLVREATEVIERLSIEAALDLSGNNRASAAEMLGLSRQSLYVKLRRYGLGDLTAAETQ